MPEYDKETYMEQNEARAKELTDKLEVCINSTSCCCPYGDLG